MSSRSVGLFLSVVFSAGSCARTPPAAADPVLAKGRQHYGRLCATCHNVAAQGYAADNAPSLRSPTFLASASNTFLQAAILRGRPGTAMGAYARDFGGPLDMEDVDAIIAFIRQGAPPPAPLPNPLIPGDPSRGKILYETMCQRCHGTKAQRISAVHLANPVLIETASDAFLRHAVELGRPPTSMAAWKDTLLPQQIADVVAFIRSMAPPPAPRPPPPAPRQGPIVLNPKGRAPEFQLKDGLYVPIDQVKKALDEERRMVICDARPASEWATLRIAGAISTPHYEPTALDDIPNDGTWVLAYCACPHHLSGEVVEALRKRGYQHTAVIDEGIHAWKIRRYPVVEAPNQPLVPAPPPIHAAPAVVEPPSALD